ncbi:MAG: ABC transporter substrate-binding protein [Magnetococcales bacterium]|nr:ABC transporter substrate-binding protein [Magnetococcales bacterium]
MKHRIGLALFVCIALQGSVWAATQFTGLQESISKAIAILRDPGLAAPSRVDERRNLLRNTIYTQFDFAAMSSNAVGPAWRNFTPQQKERFVVTFRQLLEDSYLDKIENYRGETIEFLKDVPEGPNTSRVDSVVKTPSAEYKMSYRLIKGSQGWKVFDVILEGISLGSNYRGQFQQILSRSSVDEMLVQLDNKIRDNAARRAGKK